MTLGWRMTFLSSSMDSVPPPSRSNFSKDRASVIRGRSDVPTPVLQRLHAPVRLLAVHLRLELREILALRIRAERTGVLALALLQERQAGGLQLVLVDLVELFVPDLLVVGLEGDLRVGQLEEVRGVRKGAGRMLAGLTRGVLPPVAEVPGRGARPRRGGRWPTARRSGGRSGSSRPWRACPG